MDQNVSVEGPRALLHDIKHYRQKHSWDCGVSCILMVLSDAQRRDLVANFRDVCTEEGFNKSTWTIDLTYLLKRYRINHVYYTITLGVHPEHKKHHFYMSVLTEDEARVNNRFVSAQRDGITVVERSLDVGFLLDHLRYGPIILLTNARLLHCDICAAKKLSKELRNCLPFRGSYQGHYVVLCGYDLSLGKIYYRNPALKDKVCRMSMSSLDEARKSHGTDEDVILIFKD